MRSYGARTTMAAPSRPLAAPAWAAVRLALPDLLLVLLLCALPVLFFWRMLLATPDQRLTIQEGDFTQEYFPLALVAAAALRSGEWPIWNPLTGIGQPLLADPQTALLYPPTWLFLPRLRGPDATSFQVFESQIPLHFAIAALAAYALGRYLLRSRFGALVLALTFAYSGFLTSYPAQQLPILRTAVWLPLQALALLLALDRRNWRWAAAAGLATALAILAGHPQTLLFHLYALGILTVCWWWQVRRTPTARGCGLALGALGRLGFSLGIAFLLAAPQLLLTQEFTRLSTRSDVSFAFLAHGFAPRELLLGMLAPRILGGPPPYVGGLPPYVGVLPLLLALLALALARGRTTLFGVALAGFGALLSLGGQSALFSLLYLVAPGFGLFRDQERGIELFAFGMALLAGRGAASLSGPLTPLARRQIRLVLRLGVVAAALAALAVIGLGWLFLAQSDGPTRDRVQTALDASAWFVLMLGAGLLLLHLALSRRAARALWPVGAVALVLLDLFSVGADANLADRRPDDVYRASQIVQRLRAEPPPFRVVDQDILNGHHGLVFGLPALEPGFILKVKRYEEVRQAATPQRLFDLFDGRLLVTRDRHDDLELLLEEPYGDATNRLYRLPPGPGRAWLPAEVQVAPDAAASLAAVLRPDFQPARTVILEGAPAGTRPSGSGQVESVRLGWSQTSIQVRTEQGTYLVVSQAAYPGWSARVDGAPADLLTADHALVALWVPPGEHRVTLSYWPTGLNLGLAAAGLAFSVALLTLCAPPPGRRAGKGRTP